MNIRNRLIVFMGLALAAGSAAPAQDQDVRAVYHFSLGPEQASRGLEFMRTHLEADSKSRIAVVAHAAGVAAIAACRA